MNNIVLFYVTQIAKLLMDFSPSSYALRFPDIHLLPLKL